MHIEIILEQRVVFPVEGFQVRKLAHARNLLRKHAVKSWIDAMGFDRHGDDLAHRLLDRQAHHFCQLAADDLHNLLIVTIDDRDDQRLLLGKYW